MSSVNSKDLLTVEFLMEEIQTAKFITFPVQAFTHPFEFISSLLHYVAHSTSTEIQDFIRGDKAEVNLLVDKFNELVKVTSKMEEKRMGGEESNPLTTTKKEKHNKKSAKHAGKEKKNTPKKPKGSEGTFKKGNFSPSLITALQIDATERCSGALAKKANFVRFVSSILVKLHDARTFQQKICKSQRLDDLGEYIITCYHTYKKLPGNQHYWEQRIALQGDYLNYYPFSLRQNEGIAAVDESDNDDIIINSSASYVPKEIPVESSFVNLPTVKKIQIKEEEANIQLLKVAQLEHSLGSANKILNEIVKELTLLKIQQAAEEDAKMTIDLIKETRAGNSTFNTAKQLVAVYEKIEEIIKSEKMDLSPLDFIEKIANNNVSEATHLDKCFNQKIPSQSEKETVTNAVENFTLYSAEKSNEATISDGARNQDVSNLRENTLTLVSQINTNSITQNEISNTLEVEEEAITDSQLIEETRGIVGKRSATFEEEIAEGKRRKLEDQAAVDSLLIM